MLYGYYESFSTFVVLRLPASVPVQAVEDTNEMDPGLLELVIFVSTCWFHVLVVVVLVLVVVQVVE